MKPLSSMLRTLVCIAVLATALGAVQLRAAMFQVVSVTGYVYDALSREAVNGVKVTFTDADGKATSSITHTGGYYLVTGLKPGNKYTIRIEHAGYFQTEHQFQAPNTDKYAEISRDFLVYPMRQGARLPIAVNPFYPKKSKLRVGSDDIMDNLAQMLVINPNVRIEIVAYPDNDDDTNKNLRLTMERANVLRNYLVAQGVQEARLKTSPKSEIDPINPLPVRKQAKGKQYIGKVYIVITQV